MNNILILAVSELKHAGSGLCLLFQKIKENPICKKL